MTTTVREPVPGTRPAAESVLREAGLRVTSLRLEALRQMDRLPHATADEVLEALRSEMPGTSVQSVYNVLSDLTGAGLLRRIEPANSAARFERRVGDNHHHLVCRSCGAIEDVDCAVGAAPCLVPSATHGFVIDEAEVTFWGTCPACQQS